MAGYLKDPTIIARFPKGFKIGMGFGLHFGWAIEGVVTTACCSSSPCCGMKRLLGSDELHALLSSSSCDMRAYGDVTVVHVHVCVPPTGAIGSRFKIDASYLSPNVNMAARLEAATKQYGTPLLISGALYDRLSEKVSPSPPGRSFSPCAPRLPRRSQHRCRCR